MNHEKISIQKTSTITFDDTILSAYKNEQVMIWFAKNGKFVELVLCSSGGMTSKTFTASNFSSNTIFIDLRYKIQRIGFSPTFIAARGPEFHKILFLEKSKGTFFQ